MIWWHIAVQLTPLALMALCAVALIAEGLRRLWARWRGRRG